MSFSILSENLLGPPLFNQQPQPQSPENRVGEWVFVGILGILLSNANHLALKVLEQKRLLQ